MNKNRNIILVGALFATLLNAETIQKDRERLHSVKEAVGQFAPSDEKEISAVDQFRNMFTEGKVSGQIKSMYAGYDNEYDTNTYATAIGGILKYELAEYNGFNAGVAFSTSHDIGFATGDKSKGEQNDELSSSEGSYTQVSEAYINYKYDDLNLRVGRQTIDTPLADSDDIRMIANTFEAYIATYDLSGFEFMVGNIQRWQGVDAGLDDGWISTSEDGTWLGGVSYSEKYELNAWYYNITGYTNAAYIDVGVNHNITKDIAFHGGLQYLNESELDNSGYAADIYGLLAEFIVYDIGFNVAYNKSNKVAGKASFSGTGGGTMYTSMDTLIVDDITEDRDVNAVVYGITYEIGNWKMLYAYGDFKGDKNSAGVKEHIVEQDIGFEYAINEEFYLGAIYVMQDDKEDSLSVEHNWNRAQIMVAYNF